MGSIKISFLAAAHLFVSYIFLLRFNWCKTWFSLDQRCAICNIVRSERKIYQHCNIFLMQALNYDYITLGICHASWNCFCVGALICNIHIYKLDLHFNKRLSWAHHAAAPWKEIDTFSLSLFFSPFFPPFAIKTRKLWYAAGHGALRLI